MSSFLSVEPTIVVLQNTVARVSVAVQDASGVAVAPYELKLDVMDLYGNILFSDTWPGTPARILSPGVGQFYLDFGNQVGNKETSYATEWLFNWRVTLVSGGQQQNSIQKIKVIQPRVASLIPDLRGMIDKSSKLTAPDSQCFLGYTDANLVAYLEGGLQTINAYQPSLTFTMDNFPFEYRQILVDSALITGVMSQQLYAIDTDIPNYSDQGTSFVITHQAQLAGFLNQVTVRLDKLIPMMKLQLISSGGLHIAMGPNYRLSTLINASPTGALFRNMFFRS
jgi:hypothetical protein